MTRYILWRLQLPANTHHPAKPTELAGHIQAATAHTPIASVVMQIGDRQQAYLCLSGCKKCGLGVKHDYGCKSSILERVIYDCFHGASLHRVRKGMEPRPYTRVILAWPGKAAQALDASLLHLWDDARLTMLWSRTPLQGARVCGTAILAVGGGSDDEDPRSSLHERGWHTQPLPAQLQRTVVAPFPPMAPAMPFVSGAISQPWLFTPVPPGSPAPEIVSVTSPPRHPEGETVAHRFLPIFPLLQHPLAPSGRQGDVSASESLPQEYRSTDDEGTAGEPLALPDSIDHEQPIHTEADAQKQPDTSSVLPPSAPLPLPSLPHARSNGNGHHSPPSGLAPGSVVGRVIHEQWAIGWAYHALRAGGVHIDPAQIPSGLPDTLPARLPHQGDTTLSSPLDGVAPAEETPESRNAPDVLADAAAPQENSTDGGATDTEGSELQAAEQPDTHTAGARAATDDQQPQEVEYEGGDPEPEEAEEELSLFPAGAGLEGIEVERLVLALLDINQQPPPPNKRHGINQKDVRMHLPEHKKDCQEAVQAWMDRARLLEEVEVRGSPWRGKRPLVTTDLEAIASRFHDALEHPTEAGEDVPVDYPDEADAVPDAV